ncbi:MAG: hypothetical protein A3F17_05105 [Gammaproteobacteria bacterium RIFCSPHIGHO2_12_FULL_41_15]|nr:MAG: hypothetical protein A3F17_05105 [Gammaproteobacteria bacterium RIFCSPHIGHO2_12_FULL_41_15]
MRSEVAYSPDDPFLAAYRGVLQEELRENTTRCYVNAEGDASSFTRKQLILFYYYISSQLNEVASENEQKEFLAFLRRKTDSDQKQALKFAHQLMNELRERAAAEGHCRNQYFVHYQKNDVRQNEYYFGENASSDLLSLVILSQFLSTRTDTTSVSPGGDGEFVRIVFMVMLLVALLTLVLGISVMTAGEIYKACEEIYDGRVARGALIIGSTLSVGGAVAYVTFVTLALALTTAAGPFAPLVAAAMIITCMLLTSLMSKHSYDALSTQYQLTLKEKEALKKNGKSDLEVVDIEHQIKHLVKQKDSLGYTFPWSDAHEQKRKIKMKIARLKQFATPEESTPVTYAIPLCLIPAVLPTIPRCN